MYDKVLKWVNTGAFAAMIAVNALANLLPLGGKTTGQVSESYPNLFTPAPVTFAIWGLIYLVMGLFVIEQWGVGIFEKNGPKYREAVGPWFAVSCLFNIGWIFSWHFEAIGLSVILMSGLLLSLILIEIGVSSVSAPGISRFLATGGFDLYLGWITAAFLANGCVFLSQYDGNGLFFSDTLRTFSAILVGMLIAAMIELLTGKWVAVTAVVWAFTGILIRQISPAGYAGAHPLIISTLMIGIIVILVSVLIRTMESPIFYRKGEIR